MGKTTSGEQGYLHGFTRAEQDRLVSQSRFLEPWVYERVDFASLTAQVGGDRPKVLEIGCGVGAQLKILGERFPRLALTGIDRSATQIGRARELLAGEVAQGRVKLEQAPGETLPFADGSFDGVFLCWLLEHVRDPMQVLGEARRVLRPDGVLFVTEVFLATLYVEPAAPAISAFWQQLTELQVELGGHPMIGARLGGLLAQAGFDAVGLWPVPLHLDGRIRDARERARHVTYWHELFLSAVPGLLETKRVDAGLVARMETEFQAMAVDPDAVLYVAAMQGRGQKS